MPQKAPIYQPQTDVPTKYNTRYKEFPDFVKATCFSRPIFNPQGVEEYRTRNQLEAHERMRKQKADEKRIEKDLISFGWMEKPQKENDGISRTDSMKRAKDKAYEIAYANDFQYFVTFTLDQKKINRYGTEEICKRFKKWLNHKVERNSLSYLIFPERHKDGAVHFHGLVSGDLKMVDSGRKTTRGQSILNCESWTLGFSTSVLLDESKANVCGYIMKYITKEQKKVFANHYFAGGKLVRFVPTRYENQDFRAFDADEEYSIPQAQAMVKYKTIIKEEDI